MNIISNGSIRPEFITFTESHGVSPDTLKQGIRTMETIADDPAESFLPQIIENVAASYTKTDEMMKAHKPMYEIDNMQKEYYRAAAEHPESMKAMNEVLENADSCLKAQLLPGGFENGEKGIFAADLYQINFGIGNSFLNGKLGTFMMDTTPGQDGLVYYINKTGKPSSSGTFPLY